MVTVNNVNISKVKHPDEIDFNGFTQLIPPKRGRGRESFSDAKNMIKRCVLDAIPVTDYALTYSWKLACWLFDNKCYICDDPIVPGDKKWGLQADHIVPGCFGGSGNPGNLAPAHIYCNNDKSDIHPNEYFKDKPEKLEVIKQFQRLMSFKANEVDFIIANELADNAITLIRSEVLAIQNDRLKTVKLKDSSFKVMNDTSSHVKNLLVGLNLHMELHDYAPTARKKIKGFARRILEAWALKSNEDLFVQNHAVTLSFIEEFCATLTGHPDSISRAHRAFRVLAEVYSGRALTDIYIDGYPGVTDGVGKRSGLQPDR